MQAKVDSAQRLNEILRIYERGSGQAVNKEKSSIYFSPNTPAPDKLLMKQTLNIADRKSVV